MKLIELIDSVITGVGTSFYLGMSYQENKKWAIVTFSHTEALPMRERDNRWLRYVQVRNYSPTPGGEKIFYHVRFQLYPKGRKTHTIVKMEYDSTDINEKFSLVYDILNFLSAGEVPNQPTPVK
jgi:hypothetical protein